MSKIADHPLRYKLANELHARPFPTLEPPGSVAYLALQQPGEVSDRDFEAERAHLVALLDRYGAAYPQPGATHYSGKIGRHYLKWESHTEFVTYTILSEGLEARAFDAAGFEVFPDDWLKQAPGRRITSALIRVERGAPPEDVHDHLSDWFVSESLAMSKVLDESGAIAGDFHIDPAGHVRFALFVEPGTGARRTGRILQRLCEIETYKAMAMLGFSMAQEMSASLTDLAARLTHVISAMNDPEAEPDRVLDDLLSISAALERLEAGSSFRFGATRAYSTIVAQRIAVLRETRLAGGQTFAEFMMRRFDPAMRTVESTEARLAALTGRAIRAGDLLRTKVDVARSAQNSELLESMDRRADLQLRLQQTVEGLSVVAISYYAVNLAGYLIYPMLEPLGLSKTATMAALVPPVLVAVWLMVRRIRKRLGH